jgi:hypothetical protein
MKTDPGNEKNRNDGSRSEIDDETERRPPPRVGNEVRAVLP